MLMIARSLLGLAVGQQQLARHALRAVAATYSVSSRDVAEVNQEIDDFFGVIHSRSTPSPPETLTHTLTASTCNNYAAEAPSSITGASALHNLTSSTSAPGPAATHAGHGPATTFTSTSTFPSPASSISHASSAGAGLQAFSAYIGTGGFNTHSTTSPSTPPPPPPPSVPAAACGSEQQQQRVLSHIDASGAASMVDVSEKAVTTREAQASCVVSLGSAWAPVAANSLAKGDVLKVAQLAGIAGAKATASLIPLCHNIPLSKVDVQLHLDEPRRCVVIRSLARCDGKTGVEMEALTGAAVAALTVYDMVKAAAADVVVGPLQLDYKAGGRSGTYLRAGLRRADLLPSARPPL